MTKARLEAFSDGVIAIIITIMVLELHTPEGADLASLRPLVPELASYVLSFTYVGIYWNNHHHLMHAVREVTGWTLWANLHVLFWLSLFPFATAWVGRHPGEAWPTTLYGVILLMASIAWLLLERALLARHGPDSALARAVKAGRKERLSSAAYACAIPLAFAEPWLAQLVYVAVAALWFVPDRRIEAALAGTMTGKGDER
ncbi:MAG TPA: TMEM175 family protein [Myxococcota bacterium]|nr:TMEM175 family protein [Myxococcota bacterium]